MAIRLITLDLDHTLWDTDPVLVAAEAAMFRWISEHSPDTLSIYPPAKMAEYKNQIAASYPELRDKVSALRKATLMRVFLQTGNDRERAEAMAEEAFRVFYEARSQLPLFDGVEEVMRQLREKYQLIAVTNGNADLKLAGHDRLFDDLFNADLHGEAKPAPDLFQRALDKAGVSASEAIHIGDHPQQDIAAAQQLGMKTIWFNNKGRDWPLEGVQPDRVFTHWAELHPAISALAADQS